MPETKGSEDDIVIIKKYANRRLYNTRSSSYITLDHLAKMTREGVEYKVLDAKSGADITHTILTQIIMEEESNGEQMLPVNFLRELHSLELQFGGRTLCGIGRGRGRGRGRGLCCGPLRSRSSRVQFRDERQG